jgi:L-glyceraldehyde 3-phosphate reductase
MVRRAFDLGITHFDLANNYGPPPGSAERTLGRLLREDLAGHRDEIVVSSKAGYRMWDGPYGDLGSRKYLIASIDQSLSRLGIDYLDIFYHHRPDPETPLEETVAALDQIVRSGKALYIGLSNYDAERTAQAQGLLRALGTPAIVHQPSYNMFNRWVEPTLLDELDVQGMGCVAFSPLAQGLLTNRYLAGVPNDSRANKPSGFLKPSDLTESKLQKVRALAKIAEGRGQSLAQLALAWVLRRRTVTSVLIGASRVSQIDDSVGTLARLDMTPPELQQIDRILAPSPS